MKSFQCQNCGQLLFFENTQCLNCGYQVGYLPDQVVLSAITPLGDERWQPLATQFSQQHFRKCHNYHQENVCNWLIPVDEDEIFCRACRLNQTIPNLVVADNRTRWSRLEMAKRRLIYSLLALGLPVIDKKQDPDRGLGFDFLATSGPGGPEPVTTGHVEGLITINIAEADSVVREQTRLAMNEPYRTLLGHFRHESGHYYWMWLIENSQWLERFRQLFGDEREDYQWALERHYNQGPPANWSQRFVSAYAASHPWEDWAETWAHYLHITDAIETAQEFGVSVKLEPDQSRPDFEQIKDLYGQPFQKIVDQWLLLTYALNSINRSVGQPDMYPFVLSAETIKKLDFIHQVIMAG